MRRLALASLLLASPALASEGGGASSDLLFNVINFVLLLGVLFYVGRKPIRAFFADRRETIETQLSEAAALHRSAEEQYARWQRQLVDLDREIESISSTARDRAEREGEQILADARAAAERIRRDAVSAADRELRRAKDQLRDEAAHLAIELAAGILREQVGDQDRTRLVDEFIQRIEQATPGAGVNGSGS